MEIENHIPVRSTVRITLANSTGATGLIVAYDELGITALINAGTYFYPWTSVVSVKLMESPADVEPEVWPAT